MDTAPVTARAIEFNEADHPRGKGDQGGQFVPKGAGGGGSAPTRQPYQPPQSKPGRFNRSGSRSGSSPAAPRTRYVNTLKAGQDNDPAAVQQLQAMLGELGLGQIAVDGLFGPQTEAAVKAAQTKLGLKPSGTASGALMNRLHDAHTLSPCIDRGQSKVTASVGGYDESEEDELDDEELDDEDLDDEHEEAEPVIAALGHDVTPGHDELHHYWTRGEGLAKWVDSPTPWTTLVAHLAKHVSLEKAKTFASRWFIETFGFAAGSDLNRVTHGHPPRGKLVGPG